MCRIADPLGNMESKHIKFRFDTKFIQPGFSKNVDFTVTAKTTSQNVGSSSKLDLTIIPKEDIIPPTIIGLDT